MGPLRPNEQEIGPVFVIGALASTNWVHAQIIGVDLASDPDMTGYYLPPKSQNGER